MALGTAQNLGEAMANQARAKQLSILLMKIVNTEAFVPVELFGPATVKLRSEQAKPLLYNCNSA